MVNKSRGEVAYNIVDVESEPSENVIKEIGQAEGVIAGPGRFPEAAIEVWRDQA